MSVTVQYEPNLTSTFQGDIGLGPLATNVSSRKVIGSTPNQFTATTTPPVTKDFIKELTLSGGIATLDLTVLDQGDLPDDDWTGLQVRFFRFVADDTNTNPVGVAPAAVDGYDLFGTSAPASPVVLGAGAEITGKEPAGTAVVAASEKFIEFTSAQADAKISVHLVAG